MPKLECNFQRKMDVSEAASALAEAVCHRCSVTSAVLMERGEILEVCGDEFCADMVTGEVVIVPVALCPDCHRANHLDARDQHNPCQIKARRSREML